MKSSLHSGERRLERTTTDQNVIVEPNSREYMYNTAHESEVRDHCGRTGGNIARAQGTRFC